VELISYIYNPAPYSHLEPGLLTLGLWPSSFATLAHLSRWHPGAQIPVSSHWNITEVKFPEPAKIEISIILKQQTNFRIWTLSAIFSLESNRLANFPRNHENEHFAWSFPAHPSEFARIVGPLKFRGWKVFTQFPITSPSGKRVDSDDPFPWKNSWIVVKKSPSERRSIHVSLSGVATVVSRHLLETTPYPLQIETPFTISHLLWSFLPFRIHNFLSRDSRSSLAFLLFEGNSLISLIFSNIIFIFLDFLLLAC
jgi:hypothetical protein